MDARVREMHASKRLLTFITVALAIAILGATNVARMRPFLNSVRDSLLLADNERLGRVVSINTIPMKGQNNSMSHSQNETTIVLPNVLLIGAQKGVSTCSI
jgi:hypothetical protein